MKRCFDLARLGAQSTAPNPMVGAVLVHENRIIGEGYHANYGDIHAEVAAIQSVAPENEQFLPASTMYISLEPCCHHGKTPPCTDLILEKRIPAVVLSQTDPNPKVSGKGIAALRSNGVLVTTGVLHSEGVHLLRSFTRYIGSAMPYVILKFVQSSDGYIGASDRQVWLSNIYEKILVHKMRSEIDAILVGTNTALIDNPRLTTRLYFGKDPLRVAVDRELRIPATHHILDDTVNTVIYTAQNTTKTARRTDFVQIPFDNECIPSILQDLGKRRIMTLMVEGGASLLGSFYTSGHWDEAWVVTVRQKLGEGIRAPVIEGHQIQEVRIDKDVLTILRKEDK